MVLKESSIDTKVARYINKWVVGQIKLEISQKGTMIKLYILRRHGPLEKTVMLGK